MCIKYKEYDCLKLNKVYNTNFQLYKCTHLIWLKVIIVACLHGYLHKCFPPKLEIKPEDLCCLEYLEVWHCWFSPEYYHNLNHKNFCEFWVCTLVAWRMKLWTTVCNVFFCLFVLFCFAFFFSPIHVVLMDVHDSLFWNEQCDFLIRPNKITYFSSGLSQHLVREVLIICYFSQICYSFLCKIQITKALEANPENEEACKCFSCS